MLIFFYLLPIQYSPVFVFPYPFLDIYNNRRFAGFVTGNGGKRTAFDPIPVYGLRSLLIA